MKEQINLLSPTVQKQRLSWLYGSRFGHVLSMIVLGLLLVVLTQSGIYIALKLIGHNLQAKTVVASQQVSDLEGETRNANILLGQIISRIRNYSLWTPRVESLLKVVPQGVFISSMSMDATNGTLTIKAGSVSRVAGVDFQKKLEELSWVEKVEAPLQNFATNSSEEFASFSFTLVPKVKK